MELNLSRFSCANSVKQGVKPSEVVPFVINSYVCSVLTSLLAYANSVNSSLISGSYGFVERVLSLSDASKVSNSIVVPNPVYVVNDIRPLIMDKEPCKAMRSVLNSVNGNKHVARPYVKRSGKLSLYGRVVIDGNKPSEESGFFIVMKNVFKHCYPLSGGMYSPPILAQVN